MKTNDVPNALDTDDLAIALACYRCYILRELLRVRYILDQLSSLS